MAVAAIADALVKKGMLTHQELATALEAAERLVEESKDNELTGSNRAATVFPVRVLLLANQASVRGETPSFADFAEQVGKGG